MKTPHNLSSRFLKIIHSKTFSGSLVMFFLRAPVTLDRFKAPFLRQPLNASIMIKGFSLKTFRISSGVGSFSLNRRCLAINIKPSGFGSCLITLFCWVSKLVISLPFSHSSHIRIASRLWIFDFRISCLSHSGSWINTIFFKNSASALIFRRNSK